MDTLRLPPAGGHVDLVLGPGPRCVSWSRSFASCALPKVEDASYAILWRLLSVPNIIAIVEALCTERRVLVIADNVAVLAPVCEALMSFLFPFVWPHVYIPLLPEELIMYLEAPVPFFIGINSAYMSIDVVADIVSRNSGSTSSTGGVVHDDHRRGMMSSGEDDGDATIVFLDTDRGRAANATTEQQQQRRRAARRHRRLSSSSSRRRKKAIVVMAPQFLPRPLRHHLHRHRGNSNHRHHPRLRTSAGGLATTMTTRRSRRSQVACARTSCSR